MRGVGARVKLITVRAEVEAYEIRVALATIELNALKATLAEKYNERHELETQIADEQRRRSETQPRTLGKWRAA